MNKIKKTIMKKCKFRKVDCFAKYSTAENLEFTLDYMENFALTDERAGGQVVVVNAVLLFLGD